MARAHILHQGKGSKRGHARPGNLKIMAIPLIRHLGLA